MPGAEEEEELFRTMGPRPRVVLEPERDQKQWAHRLHADADPVTPAAQPPSELREHLTSEPHDAVAHELQAMLIEMELLRRRYNAPNEVEDWRVAVWRALACLRSIVRELRDLPPGPALVETAIDRKLAGATGRRRWGGPAT